MECEDSGSTTFVEALLGKARDKIANGDGTVGSLQSASANGKSFTQTQSLTADEVLFACRQALRLYNDDAGSSPITFVDFSGTGS